MKTLATPPRSGALVAILAKARLTAAARAPATGRLNLRLVAARLTAAPAATEARR